MYYHYRVTLLVYSDVISTWTWDAKAPNQEISYDISSWALSRQYYGHRNLIWFRFIHYYLQDNNEVVSSITKGKKTVIKYASALMPSTTLYIFIKLPLVNNIDKNQWPLRKLRSEFELLRSAF